MVSSVHRPGCSCSFLSWAWEPPLGRYSAFPKRSNDTGEIFLEKKETKLPALAKRMVFTILIIALLCTLGSVIYYRSLACLPFVFGVLLGSVASIVKVFLLERTVNKVLAME